jgi:hypothetical protein
MVGVAVAAVGAALVVTGMAGVGVGDETANVAAGSPDDEHAEINIATPAATTLRTGRSVVGRAR